MSPSQLTWPTQIPQMLRFRKSGQKFASKNETLLPLSSITVSIPTLKLLELLDTWILNAFFLKDMGEIFLLEYVQTIWKIHT